MAKKGKKDSPAGLFIPGGLLTGLGVGFVVDNIPAGMFVGLGLGFVTFAIVAMTTNQTDESEE